MNKKKIIIDTDIGTDIDDVLALYYAINDENLELLGITTVYENAILRARHVKKFLSLAGVDLPVYAGYGEPLERSSHFNGIKAVDSYFSPSLYAEEYKPDNQDEQNGEEAVDYLIRSAEKYQGELTIVAIGPYTNIAKAIERNPEAMKKIEKLVIMGGNYTGQYAEWNVVCDVLAAKILFNSDLDIHCVGLNVTLDTEMSFAVHKRILEGKSEEALTDFLCDEIRKFTKQWNRKIILHDPLAVYYVTHREETFVKALPIYLETEGVCGKGVTFDCSGLLCRNELGKIKKRQCLLSIDTNKFVREIETLLTKNLNK